jgi:hypothetical protein
MWCALDGMFCVSCNHALIPDMHLSCSQSEVVPSFAAPLSIWHRATCTDGALKLCPCSLLRIAVSSTQTAAAAAAIEAAGVIAAEGADAAGSAFGDGAGHQWEVFFSRPAVSMPGLFRAVASQAAAVK